MQRGIIPRVFPSPSPNMLYVLPATKTVRYVKRRYITASAVASRWEEKIVSHLYVPTRFGSHSVGMWCWKALSPVARVHGTVTMRLELTHLHSSYHEKAPEVPFYNVSVVVFGKSRFLKHYTPDSVLA